MNVQFLIARKRLDLTQAQISEQTGIQQADISRIEKGGWTPPADLQEKLAGVLNVTVETLFGQSAEIAS